MITAVPLPSWRQLTRIASLSPLDLTATAQPWLQPGDQAVWHSRSSHSLATIAKAATRRLGRPAVVVVPAYFCAATLEPLRRVGARIQFLPVDKYLMVDWLGYPHSPDLVVLPHIFGQPTNVAAAVELCRRSGATLIEDCAHVLMPGPGVGEAGDYVLWSPHKLLAVPQGGLLVRRSTAPDAVSDLQAHGAVAAMGSWFGKRLIQKVIPGWLLPPSTRSGPQRFHDDPVNAAMADTPVLAAAAARLLTALPDLTTVAVRRHALAVAMLDILIRRSGWEPLFSVQPKAPYRLVMRCASPELAAKRFIQYRAIGLPVESWPDLPQAVTANPDQYGAAMALRLTLLCFPVHQDLPQQAVLSRLSGLTAEGDDLCPY